MHGLIIFLSDFCSTWHENLNNLDYPNLKIGIASKEGSIALKLPGLKQFFMSIH